MTMPQTADLLIVNATVYDGTGCAGVIADIAVNQDKIVEIGPDLVQRYHAGRTINANGLAAAPGFIDIHTHSDLTLLSFPAMSSSVHQGVTTEVTGNCGMSLGLLGPEPVYAFERKIIERGGLTPDWGTFAGFLSRIENTGGRDKCRLPRGT